ncbi:MAG: HDIG domain-containing protein [Christensenellaceae bacterium]|jgi:putative nucleotidyltransferase with HDIG domain|nr:HDIG domain-containing protein [Christensenellaceae bacterium]
MVAKKKFLKLPKIKALLKNKNTFIKISFTVVTSLAIGITTKLFYFFLATSADEIKFSWQDVSDIFIISVAMTVVFITLLRYLKFTKLDEISEKTKYVALFSIILLDCILRLIFTNFVSAFLIPFSLAGLLTGLLLNRRVGVTTNIFVNVAFFLNTVLLNEYTDLAMGVASLISAIVFGTLLLTQTDGAATTRMRFTGVGFISALVATIVPSIICFFSQRYGTRDALIYGACGFLSALISTALFTLTLPLFELLFRITTIFRLSEITSLESPLMKKLANEAPGTFSHSIMVGNLAELCAMAIGESAQLAKATGYYHDVGKINNPTFFIENQKGYNPHDDVIPELSVQMITSHTKDGYEMIKKARLPDILADVAHEHHGTTSVNYFLYKAQNLTEGNVDHDEFSYSDPKPSTKISAIVMIADTVEAATRSVSGTLNTEKEYRTFINSLIKAKSDAGQFSECNLTFNDLRLIEDTLVYIIPEMHHQRIQYVQKSAKE